jgi:hypothetical protein
VFCHLVSGVMDPVSAVGIAFSVIGLVPLCAAGFQMIENCVDAPKDAVKEFDFVKIQSGVSGYSIS